MAAGSARPDVGSEGPRRNDGEKGVAQDADAKVKKPRRQRRTALTTKDQEDTAELGDGASRIGVVNVVSLDAPQADGSNGEHPLVHDVKEEQIEAVSRTTGIPEWKVKAALNLRLRQGNTVPFITRYRQVKAST